MSDQTSADTYYFEQGQPAAHTGLFIFQTGTYAATDLVPCALTPDSSQSYVSYQAHYLATGTNI